MIRSLPLIRSSFSSRSSILSKSLSSASSSLPSPPPSSSRSSPSESHRRSRDRRRRFAVDRPRTFSSSSEKGKGKDLREAVERLGGGGGQADGGGTDSADAPDSSADSAPSNPHLDRLATAGASFLGTVSDTWGELVASGRAQDINKKIGGRAGGDGPNYADDDEAADAYESYKGSRDIMVIDPQEHLNAWERMERRLRDAPIIQGEHVKPWIYILVGVDTTNIHEDRLSAVHLLLIGG